MGAKNKTDSLCWLCARACGGCSWSDSFTPIEGWTAEETTVYGGQTSYNVIACPLFTQEDNRTADDLDDDGCMALIGRLLDQTHDDYIHGGEVTVREIERFIRGKGASKLHQISNPEEVIRELRKQRRLYWLHRIPMVRGGS